MRLAYRKSTNTVINDFQSDATAEGLINNAVTAGIPLADIEVRDVTPDEFMAIEDATNSAARAILRDREAALTLAAKALQTRLGLTNAEVRALRRLLNES